MTGVLIFNGEESNDSDDIIAAFVDDECRGVKTDGIFFSGRMVFGLTIFGNQNGESLTFKSYDASNDQINDNIDFTYSFVPNGVEGSLENPIEWGFIGADLSTEFDLLPGNFVLYPAYPNPSVLTPGPLGAS